MSDSEIFKAAVKLPTGERAAYLDQACGDNPELRQEVESLLQAHEASGTFLVASEATEAPTADFRSSSTQPGTIIGPYKLLQRLGEGGMGTVFMAQQAQPIRRLVALKLIKPGMDSQQVIARFEAERQALALMDHPNIARVLDAGTTPEGRPYFVMELVKGVPITRYCDENRLTHRQRLELFIPVCQAVQHAHQKGIIHRDLKPGNVLVAPYDGKPVPKVIDFGVAKAMGQQLTEHTLVTGFGAIVGTLEYMSPEQAELNQLDIDTRSDIYALGVMLYELLTGTTPLDRKRLTKAAFTEMLRLIREVEPPKPSTRLSNSKDSLPSISVQRQMEPAKLTRTVRGELDWIVMKALEKDRSRRYETANGFAMDIQRYLDDEPVQACPPSAGYRFRKLVRRNKVILGTALIVTVALVIGTAAATWQAVRATKAEGLAQERLQTANAHYREAEKQREAAQTQERLADEQRKIAFANESTAKEQELLAHRRFYAAQMNLAQQAWEQGNPSRVLQLLENQRPKLDEEDLRTFEWYYLWRLCNTRRLASFKHPGVSFVAVSADGRFLASSSSQANIKIWDLATRQELITFRGYTVEFLHDGKTLASGVDHGNIQLYDVGTWREQTILKGPPDMRALAFSPDRKTIAAGKDVVVDLLDAATGQTRAILPGHAGPVICLAFSPDNRMLATVAKWQDSKVKLWDLTSAPPRLLRECDGNGPVAFLPDSKTLAAGDRFRARVHLWDVATGQEHGGSQAQTDAVSLGKSNDGKTIAIGWNDGTLRLWEPSSGRQSAMPCLQPVESVVFTPDGKTIASASANDITLWAVDRHPQEIVINGHAVPQRPIGRSACQRLVAYSPDSKTLAYVGMGGMVKLCDPATGQERAALNPQSGEVLGMTFSRDSRRIAVWHPNCVRVWDLTLMQSVGTFNPGAPGVVAMAMAPDGQTVATGGATLTLWNVETRQTRTITDAGWVNTLIYSQDGKTLITCIGAIIQYWNAETLTRGLGFRTTAREQWILDLAFSPDGRTLFAGGKSGWLRSYDAEIGMSLVTFRGHTAVVNSLALLPDGRTLISGSDDGTIKLWDVPTGQERFSLVGHQGKAVGSVTVAPDGKTFATGGLDGTVRLWHAPEDKEASARKTELDPDDPDNPVALDSAGERLRNSGNLNAAAAAYVKVQERLARLDAAFPMTPQSALIHNNIARFLATCPDPKLRDASGALASAKKAVELAPDDGNTWNTLGVAHYRAGDWKAAIATLDKSIALRNGGDSVGWFFLAMARWQLGDRTEARQWYDKAVQWMEKNQPKDEELVRFRAEAEHLLELKK